MYTEYTEWSVMGIQCTSGRHGNVCTVIEHDEVPFSDLSVAVPWQERLAQ